MIVPDASLLIYAYESASTDGDFDRRGALDHSR